jgi:hypothetical protein
MIKLIGLPGQGGREMVGKAISRTRGRRLVLGAAVALALLAVVGRIQQGVMTPHRPAPAPAPSTTIARRLPVTATIGLGAPAAPQFADQAQLMAGEGGLWAVLEGVLVRVDPRRTSAMARIRLGAPDDFVRLLTVGAGAAWVATEAGVVRVDAATNRVAATLPADTAPQAAGAGSLWSVHCTSEDGPCRLLRLDPHSLRVLARFRLPGPPAGSLAVGDDSVWLLDQSERWVWRVDLAGGRVARVQLPRVQLPSVENSADVPNQLVVGEEAVWVLTSVESPTRLGVRVDAGLVRIDSHTNRISATTPLANLGGDLQQAQLTVGAGVWVEGQHSQDRSAHAVIDRVDPTSGRLLGTIETGDLSPAGLAAGFGALWLLRPAAGALLRLDPAAM